MAEYTPGRRPGAGKSGSLGRLLGPTVLQGPERQLLRFLGRAPLGSGGGGRWRRGRVGGSPSRVTAAVKSLASRAPGRNSGELPVLECALGAFSANGMWGRGHCAWDCFPLVVDQQRFRLLNTGSESLRFYQGWVWQSRSISLANSRTPVVREQEGPAKTPGHLEDKHITSLSAEIQLPLELKHDTAQHRE